MAITMAVSGNSPSIYNYPTVFLDGNGVFSGSISGLTVLDSGATITVSPSASNPSAPSATATVTRTSTSFSIAIPRSWLSWFNGLNYNLTQKSNGTLYYDLAINVKSTLGYMAGSAAYAGLPSDVKPAIGNVSVAFTNNSTLDALLQNKTTLTTVTATGLTLSEGTPYFRQAVVVLSRQTETGWAQVYQKDETYPGNASTLTVSINRLMEYTRMKVDFYLYDTRSIYAIVSKEFDFLPYTPPLIESYSAFRCDQDGTENNLGGWISLMVNWTYDDLGGVNSAGASFVWGPQGGTMSAPINLPSGVLLGPFGDGNIDPETTYVFRVTVADQLESVTTQDLLIRSMVLCFVRLAGGKGAAFGKNATEENLVDSVWAIKAPRFELENGYYWAPYTPNNVYFPGNYTGVALFDPGGFPQIWVSNFVNGDGQNTIYTRGVIYQNRPEIFS